jgi:hypothetical protein
MAAIHSVFLGCDRFAGTPDRLTSVPPPDMRAFAGQGGQFLFEFREFRGVGVYSQQFAASDIAPITSLKYHVGKSYLGRPNHYSFTRDLYILPASEVEKAIDLIERRGFLLWPSMAEPGADFTEWTIEVYCCGKAHRVVLYSTDEVFDEYWTAPPRSHVPVTDNPDVRTLARAFFGLLDDMRALAVAHGMRFEEPPGNGLEDTSKSNME